MAQRVLLVCDLHDDDTTGAQTIPFAFEGTFYEVDVCDQHATELRNAFAPYIGHARRAGGGRTARSRSTGRGTTDRTRTAEIRRWARAQGRTVPDRGRLPAAIVEAYDSSH